MCAHNPIQEWRIATFHTAVYPRFTSFGKQSALNQLAEHIIFKNYSSQTNNSPSHLSTFFGTLFIFRIRIDNWKRLVWLITSYLQPETIVSISHLSNVFVYRCVFDSRFNGNSHTHPLLARSRRLSRDLYRFGVEWRLNENACVRVEIDKVFAIEMHERTNDSRAGSGATQHHHQSKCVETIRCVYMDRQWRGQTYGGWIGGSRCLRPTWRDSGK